ncbi:MAG: 5-oxoprolinase subunit PxpB [Rhodanobacteraceae bacterium]
MKTDFTAEALAEDALLVRFGDTIDAVTNSRVHAAAQAVREAALPGVIDIAPAYASLLLRFDPFAWDDSGKSGTLPQERFADALRTCLRETAERTLGPGFRRDNEQNADGPMDAPVRIVEIPVCYGGDFGLDLTDAASHARMTTDEIIARHTAGEYTVAMLGFAPGFPYLLGLDPTLHMPRRATPRTRVPAGSVAIGGAQAGIYPCELPGGWQLIGRTPLAVFDPERDRPCLLAPGDRVRFCAIDAAEFAQLTEHPA